MLERNVEVADATMTIGVLGYAVSHAVWVQCLGLCLCLPGDYPTGHEQQWSGCSSNWGYRAYHTMLTMLNDNHSLRFIFAKGTVVVVGSGAGGEMWKDSKWHLRWTMLTVTMGISAGEHWAVSASVHFPLSCLCWEDDLGSPDFQSSLTKQCGCYDCMKVLCFPGGTIQKLWKQSLTGRKST